jgi:hypothetical protein
VHALKQILERNKQKLTLIPQLIIFAFPLIINYYAIIDKIGVNAFKEIMSGKYFMDGVPYNPWLEFIPQFILINLILLFLARIIIKILVRAMNYFADNILKTIILFVIASLGSSLLTLGTFILSLTWFGKFNNFFVGLPISEIVMNGTSIVQFPTVLLLFIFSAYIKIKTSQNVGSIEASADASR